MGNKYIWGKILFWVFLVISVLLGIIALLISFAAAQKGELAESIPLLFMILMVPIGICLTGRWMKNSVSESYRSKEGIERSIQLFNYSYPIGALLAAPLLGILHTLALPESDSGGSIGNAIFFGCLAFSLHSFHQQEKRKLSKQELKDFFFGAFPMYFAINMLYTPIAYAYILSEGLNRSAQDMIPAAAVGIVVAFIQFIFSLWMFNIIAHAFKKKEKVEAS